MAPSSEAPPPTKAPKSAEAGLRRVGSMAKAASPLKLMNGHCGLSDSRVLVRRRVRVFDPEPGYVERRKEDKGQKRRDRQAAHDRVGHRTPEDGRRDRDHAEDCGGSGEQDLVEPGLGGLDERIPRVPPLLILLLDLVDKDHRVAC